MPFLKNCWYMAGFSEELNEGPLGRDLLNQKIVMYRTEAGDVVALGDICPHRFAPLHLGRVFGDTIRCPYHGLKFDRQGKCVENPVGNHHVPRAAQVPVFAVREIDGMLWLWFGEDVPDEDKIVRFEVFQQPDEWPSIEMRIPVEAPYMLVSDNLLDLSHAEFLHSDLATPGSNDRVQTTVSQEGDMVISDNWRPSEPITNAFRAAMGPSAPDVVDHHSIVKWFPPAVLHLDISARPVGAPPNEGVKSITAHCITPETKTTCHYFIKSARNYGTASPQFTERGKKLVEKAFVKEDKTMIEAQQRNLGERSFDEANPIILSSDKAAVLARNVMRAKLKAQEASRSA